MAVADDGSIYVADNGQGSARVLEVDPVTGDQSLIAPNIGQQPYGIDVDPLGNILTFDSYTDWLVQIDPPTGIVSNIYDFSGKKIMGIDYYMDSIFVAALSGYLYKINPTTGNIEDSWYASGGNFRGIIGGIETPVTEPTTLLLLGFGLLGLGFARKRS